MKAGPVDTTRDFLDVRDVASALHLIARKGRRDAVYNVGSGRETSIREVLSMLLRISGRTAVVAAPADVPAGVQRHVADIARLQSIGFTPEFTLQASLWDLFHAEEDPRRLAHQ